MNIGTMFSSAFTLSGSIQALILCHSSMFYSQKFTKSTFTLKWLIQHLEFSWICPPRCIWWAFGNTSNII